MGLSVLFVAVALSFFGDLHGTDLHPFSDEFIDHINSLNLTWKAKRFFNEEAHFRRLLGSLPNPDSNLPVKTVELVAREGLPEYFDAREKWPSCRSLFKIRDQGDCGNCWAISSTSAMTDRYCIATNGQYNFDFSTEDLTSCCTTCGKGCNGGDEMKAFNYWATVGIVSGGDYHSSLGCRPYTIAPCDHTGRDIFHSCSKNVEPTPICRRTCQLNYPGRYESDLVRARSVYRLNSEEDIMAELVTNGPVVASFKAYDDFGVFDLGVYTHKYGVKYVGHAVKIIGYGVEDGVKYWLVANSWGETWGRNGFFKIRRGVNECDIESRVVAGEPLL